MKVRRLGSLLVASMVSFVLLSTASAQGFGDRPVITPNRATQSDGPELAVYDLQIVEGASFNENYVAQFQERLHELTESIEGYAVVSGSSLDRRLRRSGQLSVGLLEDTRASALASAIEVDQFILITIDVADSTHYSIRAIRADAGADESDWRVWEETRGRSISEVESGLVAAVEHLTAEE